MVDDSKKRPATRSIKDLREQMHFQKQADAPPQGLPWARFHKDDIPRYSFSLRLNEYQLELLRQMAARDRRSMQFIAKELLLAHMEEFARHEEAEALTQSLLAAGHNPDEPGPNGVG